MLTILVSQCFHYYIHVISWCLFAVELRFERFFNRTILPFSWQRACWTFLLAYIESNEIACAFYASVSFLWCSKCSYRLCKFNIWKLPKSSWIAIQNWYLWLCSSRTLLTSNSSPLLSALTIMWTGQSCLNILQTSKNKFANSLIHW